MLPVCHSTTASTKLTSTVRHLLFCVCLLGWVTTFCWMTGSLRPSKDDPLDALDPWEEYGAAWTCLLIVLRLLPFLGLPQTLFNTGGLMLFKAFPGKVHLKASPVLAPFICVRVVTRGLYPRLVKSTVAKNVETLERVGVDNYVVEVVTDTPLNLGQGNPKVQETVVPTSYLPKSGAMFKSRALQYCLEDDVNKLSDDDWIVHLDEETLLTDNSVRGILNFICSGDGHDFGQGLITYGHAPARLHSWTKAIQNRICTVADSFRAADDMGKLRCQFRIFHKPLFGWKGSYVVTRAGAERSVSFDNGPEGSKAEDCFFAMAAMDSGKSFDFIEGEMHEKSPFTFTDFFRQRQRWMQGIYMVVVSSRISTVTKSLLATSLSCWLTLPFSVLNLFLSQTYPMTLGRPADILMSYIGAMGLFMYGYGYIIQHPIHRFSWLRLMFAVPEIIVASTLSLVMENVAVCSMWFGEWYNFYIVEKESDQGFDEEKRQSGIEVV